MTDGPDTLVREADQVINSTSRDIFKDWLKDIRPS